MSAHLEFLEGAGARARRWALAAAMMMSMHAAAGAIAVMHWPEEEASDEESGAFMLELAPVPVAPPTEHLNLAIGPRAEEAAAAVAPTEEVKEKSEIETPKVEEAPLAPEPEVVVEKQKPVEEVEDEKEEEDPRPEQEALPQASAASQETSAPPPVEAPAAEKPAAPKAGLSSKPSEATMSWQKSLVHHLNKHKKYPHEARKRGSEGVANVSFTIDRSGKVIETQLTQSSGSDLLDQEAIEVLERASPFPTPPSEMPNITIKLSLPIQFRIKR
jgi:protein TonB